ncbi:MAG: LCP family protein [Nitriliruptoraceae bacterium]
MSALVPGLGQLVLRRWWRGSALLVVALLLAAAGAWAAQAPDPVLTWLLHPDALPWLLSGNLLVFIYRLAAAVDAYVLGARPPAIPALPRGPAATLATAGGLGVLLAAVALPHAAVGYATYRTTEVVDNLFVAEAPEPPDPPIPAGPDAVTGDVDDRTATDDADDEAATGDAADGVEGTDRDRQPPSTRPERPPAPDPADLPKVPDNPWLADERLTVAVLGSDAGPGRVGSRLDAMLVASLDTRTGRATVVSVDRYLADFPLPDHLADLYAANCPQGDGWRYLNALYTCGLERIDEELAALYPDAVDPAARAVTDTLATLLDLPIDHYALVDMAGFVGVVDALGGVELDVGTPMTVRLSPSTPKGKWRTFALDAGPQQLGGEEAMAYVRMRDSEGDRGRMARQRCFVAGAVAAADPPSLLRGFPALATAIEEHLVTDVAVTQLPALLQLLLQVDLGPVMAEGFGPPDYRGGDHVPDVDAIRSRFAALLDGEVEDGDLEVDDAIGVCP